MAGFTKGPWDINFKVNGHLGFSIEPVNDCTSCATVYLDQYDSSTHDQHRDPCNATSVANAQLIAASPDMYEAAKNLIDDVRQRYPNEKLRCKYMRALDASLRKARGEA